jgi:hypothetical protein
VSEARRRAYLEALGFDVWVPRLGTPAGSLITGCPTGRLQLGPGQGSTLVVCATAEDSATRFAGDLARALGSDPVWAWPDRQATADALALEEAIGVRLITRVIVLGAEPARWLFADTVPAVVGSAAVAIAASVNELGARGAARRALWRSLRGGPSGRAAPAAA